MQIFSKPVKNFSPGRHSYIPKAIVIHSINESPRKAQDTFNDKECRRSMNYTIGSEGGIWKMVNEEDTAWHTRSLTNNSWKIAKKNVNPDLYTIGIGLEVDSNGQCATRTYEACSELITDISPRWGIHIDRNHIVGVWEINNLSGKNQKRSIDLDKLVRLANHFSQSSGNVDSLTQRLKSMADTQAILINKITNLQLLQASSKVPKGHEKTGEILELEIQNKKLTEEIIQLHDQIDKLKKKLGDKNNSNSESLVDKIRKLFN